MAKCSTHSQEFIKNKIVKFIGDPSKRIEEDYLRIIRYIRFSLQYETPIDAATIKIINFTWMVLKISKERIILELNKNFDIKKFYKNIAS